MPTSIPVLIVGAGPTGLSMAFELKRHGVDFRIIDKQIKPVKTSNALGVQTRTLEVWDDMGLVKEMLAQGCPIKGFNIYANKKQIAHVYPFELLSLYPFVLALSQQHTEEILIKHLESQNVKIEMNVDMIDLKQQENNCLITLNHADGKKETIETTWVIGCDGAHSYIREKCNIPFQGKELPQHFVLADTVLKTDLPSNQVHAFLSEKGPLFFIRYDDKYFRIILEVSAIPELANAKTISYEQLKNLVKDRCFLPIEIEEPIWNSGFWIHERMASTFRQNNLFLLGDAAHIHSPAGAQGMNTGIQDAYNLAWKLASVIKKTSPPELLNTYNQERLPFAKKILKNTTFLTHFVSLKNPFLCALRNLFLSHLLKIKKFRNKVFSNLTQLNIYYKNSGLTKDCLGAKKGPKAGTRLLDAKYNDTQSLMDHVRGTTWCLLVFFDKNLNFSLGPIQETLEKKFGSCVKLIGISLNPLNALMESVVCETIFDINKVLHQLYEIKGTTFFLIRPDKYIGFRGNEKDEKILFEYLHQFLQSRSI